MAHLYYVDELNGVKRGSTVTVEGEEARHAIRVSRLMEQERTRVGDGQGTIIDGTVTRVDGTTFSVKVDHVEQRPSQPPHIWLVQALAKGDRAERAVEQSTEFGVHGIIPWAASRSIVKWDSHKSLKNQQRWQKIAREASKQSLRATVPQVDPVHHITDLSRRFEDNNSLCIILHPEGNTSLTALSTTVLATLENIYVCVGPEGGITNEELARFTQTGAQVCTVGSEVLRTSSAGPASLAVLNVLLERW